MFVVQQPCPPSWNTPAVNLCAQWPGLSASLSYYASPQFLADFRKAIGAPAIDTRLLPPDGFGRPHTITGGF